MIVAAAMCGHVSHSASGCFRCEAAALDVQVKKILAHSSALVPTSCVKSSAGAVAASFRANASICYLPIDRDDSVAIGLFWATPSFGHWLPVLYERAKLANLEKQTSAVSPTVMSYSYGLNVSQCAVCV